MNLRKDNKTSLRRPIPTEARIDGCTFHAAVKKDAEITIGSFFYPSWKARSEERSIDLFTDEEDQILHPIKKSCP